MTEEIRKIVEPMQEQINDLTNKIKALNNNATIPFEVGEAIKARVLSDAGVVQLSGKSKDSENQTVDESGTAPVYSVLGPPDGFLEVTLSGTKRYIPFYE